MTQNTEPIPEPSEIANSSTNLPVESQENQLSNLVPDEMLLGVYGEIMGNLRLDRGKIEDDRKQLENLVDTFADMVINEGDSTTSSKEALVNLVKAKLESSSNMVRVADSMAKVADLMTRIKLKDRDTYKPFMGKGNSSNTINIIENPGGNSKKAIIEALKAKQKDK